MINREDMPALPSQGLQDAMWIRMVILMGVLIQIF